MLEGGWKPDSEGPVLGGTAAVAAGPCICGETLSGFMVEGWTEAGVVKRLRREDVSEVEGPGGWWRSVVLQDVQAGRSTVSGQSP